MLLAVLLCFVWFPFRTEKPLSLPSGGPSVYVNDAAEVLEDETEELIGINSGALRDKTGAEIAVVTVTDLGGEKSVKDYTVRLFNQWGIGDARENNGFLLVLLITPDPDDGDYFLATGDGAEKILSNSEADDLLYEALEPDFAVGSYDAGVRKLCRELFEIVKSYYGIEIDYTDADVL